MSAAIVTRRSPWRSHHGRYRSCARTRELGAGVNEHHCASVLPMRAQKRTSVSRSATRSRANRSSSAAYRSIRLQHLGVAVHIRLRMDLFAGFPR